MQLCDFRANIIYQGVSTKHRYAFPVVDKSRRSRVRKYKYKCEHVPLKFFKYHLSRTPPHSIAIKNHEEIYGSMFSMLVCINKFKKGAFFGKLAILHQASNTHYYHYDRSPIRSYSPPTHYWSQHSRHHSVRADYVNDEDCN